MLETFLESLRGSRKPDKQHLALACSVPLAGTRGRQTCFALWPLLAFPSTVQAVAICGFLCGCCQMAPGGSWTVTELNLQGPLPGGLGAGAPTGQLQNELEHQPATSNQNTPKGQTGQASEAC